MSWAHIQAAFEFSGECSADALHALRIIAYNVRDNDYAFCGTDYIRRKMGRKSRKTAQAAVNELVERGYIIRESGKYSGHRNHYFINIPGAPAPQVGKLRPEVSKPCPQPLCTPCPPVGNLFPKGWVNNAAGKRKVKQIQNPVIRNPLPPKRTPPLNTPAFRDHALQICYECGASQSKAIEFYKQHQAENWAVLDSLPLEVAAMRFVEDWKQSDTRAWTAEALRRYKTPEIEGI